MATKEYKWEFVADSVEQLGFGKYDIVQAEIGERTICIARHKDQLYGFQSKFPHAGAKMVMGYIDAQGNALCPLHRFTFSLRYGNRPGVYGTLQKRCCFWTRRRYGLTEGGRGTNRAFDIIPTLASNLRTAARTEEPPRAALEGRCIAGARLSPHESVLLAHLPWLSIQTRTTDVEISALNKRNSTRN